jgi:hypothetical protein
MGPAVGEVERRHGARIAAKGIYRDAVRSHFVKASGLRWVSLMLVAPIPWAYRVWALPFLTALAPSERADAERQRRHKILPDSARHLLLAVCRWQPGRAIVAVAGTNDVGEQLRLTGVPGRLLLEEHEVDGRGACVTLLHAHSLTCMPSF